MEKENKKNKVDRYNDPFPSRLRELMEDHQPPITRQKLAEVLGVTPQQISNYTVGTSLPDFNCICKLAAFFEISSDYLLGISDNKSPDINIREISKITGLTEHSIAVLRSETQYVCDFSKKQTPQEALKYYFSKCEEWSGKIEYPRFHIINLLLADSPINLNYKPIIEILGEILEFRMQDKNTKAGQQKYYGLFQNKLGSEEFDFETEEEPVFLMDHNEILDILLVQLQGTIKRYKDEHEKENNQ